MTVKWNDTNFRKEIKIRSRSMLQGVAEHVKNTSKTIITEKDIIDTGNLRRSIKFRTDDKDLIAWIGTNVKYAPFLELGHRTRGGTTVAPRSYLRAALDQLDQQTVDRIIARKKKR